MLRRLLKADLRRGRAIVVTLTALIALASMLMAASTSLIVNTVTSTKRLSERAEVPDLVQMHSGDADPQAIGHWARSHALIRDYEVIKTLPVPRHQLWISGTSQAGTYHEPAFVTANERIDLLLDEDGRPVRPSPGEVALPVHYQATGAARIGDTVTVDTGDWRLDLTVVDFVRDAQMNAAMIPSKRVVVSDQDYAALEERLSEPEYLIEFTLTQDAKPGTVLAEYKAAGLPSQGISITASMISLMNALSTMLIAAVTLLVALVLMTVSVLALRYTILAAIEADLAQIAVLKAIGAPQPRIRVLYLMKYLVLAAAGSLVGYLLGLPLASVLGAATTTYLGRPPTTVWTVCLPILSVLALAAAIVCLTWLTLRRVGRISLV